VWERLAKVRVHLLPKTWLTRVKMDAEDAQHHVYSVEIEYIGQVPQLEWCSQIVLKLSAEEANLDEPWLSIKRGDQTSNRVLIKLKCQA